MIRFLRAFAWLRWRLVVSTLRGGKRRDSLESFSRVTALAVPVLVFGLILSFALVLGVLAYVGGTSMGSGSTRALYVMAGPRLLLGIVVLCLIVIPAGPTTVAGHARLLLLPVPRGALHLLEVLSAVAGPWIAALVPGLSLIALGLLVSGRASEAILAAIAALALVTLMASLSASLASLTHWIMRNRRRSELVAIVGVLAICFISIVPALRGDALEARLRTGGRPGRWVEELDRGLPGWSRFLPTELYGRSIEHAVEGRDMTAWFSVALLVAEAAALFALSSLLHEKLLRASESSRGRARATAIGKSPPRIPGLTPAASAIAAAQLRTALRSVRGRIAMLLPAPVVAVLAIGAREFPGEIPGGAFFAAHGPSLLGIGVVFSFYALLAFTMNQFGTDRAGLARWMLAPVRDVDLVVGKATGCALLTAIPILTCFAIAVLLCPQGAPQAWISVLIAAAATQILLSPVAVLLSATFPVAADLSKTGAGGNPHGLAMLVGMLLVLALTSIPGVIMAVVDRQLQQPTLSLALIAAWASIAAFVATPLTRLAARAVAPRRENLVLVAGGR